MNQDSWNTEWKYSADEYDLLSKHFTNDELLVTMNNISPYKELSTIDIPDWADIDSGYHPVMAEKLGNTDGDFAAIITYSPNATLGIGYKRVFIVERSTKKPFPRTREMWTELRNRSLAKQKNKPIQYINTLYSSTDLPKGYGIPDNITISENGELRSAFGVPKTNDLFGIVFEFGSIYNDWCKFPNETDYSVIETLKEAKKRVRNMQLHADGLGAEIEESRRLIKEHQDRIAELEKQMNKMYEEGADALNLLEKHGIQLDLNGIIQDDYDSFDINIMSGMMMPMVSDFSGQYITISDPGLSITSNYNT